jgi:hypothetical protein
MTRTASGRHRPHEPAPLAIRSPALRQYAAQPTRRPWRLVRAWQAARAYWLARRLARVEAELQTLTARLQGADGHAEISREDLLARESCSIEIATLRAQIARCRALS